MSHAWRIGVLIAVDVLQAVFSFCAALALLFTASNRGFDYRNRTAYVVGGAKARDHQGIRDGDRHAVCDDRGAKDY